MRKKVSRAYPGLSRVVQTWPALQSEELELTWTDQMDSPSFCRSSICSCRTRRTKQSKRQSR
eukprot:2359166-Rhodomonas_salina.1